jgi:hypothetical protein
VLDPEPPPRPWWWRAAISAGVLAAAAAVATVIVFWPLASGPARSSAAGPALPAALDRGQIVFRDANGYLALADPDGTHVTPLKILAVAGVSASPDDRYLSDGVGLIYAVKTGPQLASYPSKIELSSSNGTAQPYPFADHDQDLVLLQNFGDPTSSVQNPAWVVSISTGKQVSLGVVDAAAGDPQTAGAFVSVAGPPVASSTPTQLYPDADVELREAGHPPVVLATAAAINSDLGVVDGPVQLIPVPDPAGDKIAVEIRPAAAGGFAGIVVLNRAGQMLGTTGPLPFRGITGLPAWSPSGSSLAYVSPGSAVSPGGQVSPVPILHTWTIGEQPTNIAWPSSPSVQGQAGAILTGGSCFWSPDGTAVLCDFSAPPGKDEWAVTAASHPVKVVAGPALPVAWLPGKAGR